MGRQAEEIISGLQNGVYDEVLRKIYIDESVLQMQRERYVKAIQEYIGLFGNAEVEIYSAPGRSEIGGNHTDHQHGKVLASSVNIDIIAVVSPTDDQMVHFKSEGYDRIDTSVADPVIDESIFGTTRSLIHGIAAGLRKRGYQAGGFNAYATSQVLSGSGLSSSAAFEILVGNILSGLYNEEKLDAVTLAQIGQEAENIYFGKPSGLMDQMACSVGGLIFIDFADPKTPQVKKVDVDFSVFKHSLCIVDTKGSHADLTDDYAAIPVEMCKVAAYFGKKVLREVDEAAFYQALPEIRKAAGDRAVLRAIHFFDENARVDEEVAALQKGDFEAFKAIAMESGQSSYKYLQNVYACHKPEEMSVAVSLVMTKKLLGDKAAYRVHGGGFAGTIQAFIPDDAVAAYKEGMEKLLGEGSCHVMKVRPIGGCKVL
ncbi:MAG: galactokinase family protein [Eubacteriales bacterium]|nr:galactokinase family protein [Eubacteriales bacterium]